MHDIEADPGANDRAKRSPASREMPVQSSSKCIIGFLQAGEVSVKEIIKELCVAIGSTHFSQRGMSSAMLNILPSGSGYCSKSVCEYCASTCLSSFST